MQYQTELKTQLESMENQVHAHRKEAEACKEGQRAMESDLTSMFHKLEEQNIKMEYLKGLNARLQNQVRLGIWPFFHAK
jgi:hypothetical protein